ncbi:MAG: hypothetical protein A3B73_05565 [Omnitrophica WOR_2 bacterium RIFCSPHIGHO2_02_FULL_63_39]|nr:MAG: hypothetical protein A3B73_05565 [Omnitrophica WOR_2 bacterium RIFCSPHIGHO2_02_FULL_63_39]OGX47226.1 MAG: hypothetical protein A3G88_07405 [Omnitrophica WOR_2 bacterium RIFCSPLOWO2_12_FULL_63_16]
MSVRTIQPIAAIRHRHPREWLLIEVARLDRRTTTPVTGRLVAHAKRPERLERQAARTKGLVYLVFGSDTLPKGYAAAF